MGGVSSPACPAALDVDGWALHLGRRGRARSARFRLGVQLFHCALLLSYTLALRGRG